MTREDEIKQEAQKFAFTMSEEDEVLKYEAFKAGAEWADAHPIHYDGKAYLYVLHKGVEQGKKEMLEKACEWLSRHFYDKEYEIRDDEGVWIDADALIENFKKAIEDNSSKLV